MLYMSGEGEGGRNTAFYSIREEGIEGGCLLCPDPWLRWPRAPLPARDFVSPAPNHVLILQQDELACVPVCR